VAERKGEGAVRLRASRRGSSGWAEQRWLTAQRYPTRLRLGATGPVRERLVPSGGRRHGPVWGRFAADQIREVAVTRTMDQALPPPSAILTEHAPDAAVALAGVQALVPQVTDPVLAELARLRMAQLLGDAAGLERRSQAALDHGLDEETIADLPQWPVSDRYSARERDCLALAEQYVIDVSAVTDAQTGAVLAHLGAAGLYGFVQALYAIDESIRLELALAAAFADVPPQPEETP
jgi:alkylhydroperoxidase family enzyme